MEAAGGARGEWDDRAECCHRKQGMKMTSNGGSTARPNVGSPVNALEFGYSTVGMFYSLAININKPCHPKSYHLLFFCYFTSPPTEIEMNIPGHTTNTACNNADLHFMDGTESKNSYAVVARRGNIFLGVKLSGLTDGEQLGMPGKSYLHARVRSARDQTLAAKLDLEAGVDKVVPLFGQQLALDEAWPNFTFEKIDEKRASVVIGMFIDGSLAGNTDAVITRIEEADLFRKIVDYVIGEAGRAYRIARAKVAATWLSDQAQPTLDGLKKFAELHKTVLEAQKEFGGLVEGQIEVVGSHLQQLNSIYHKHQQIHGTAEISQPT
jgi:hypothetical protein